MHVFLEKSQKWEFYTFENARSHQKIDENWISNWQNKKYGILFKNLALWDNNKMVTTINNQTYDKIDCDLI